MGNDSPSLISDHFGQTGKSRSLLKIGRLVVKATFDFFMRQDRSNVDLTPFSFFFVGTVIIVYAVINVRNSAIRRAIVPVI